MSVFYISNIHHRGRRVPGAEATLLKRQAGSRLVFLPAHPSRLLSSQHTLPTSSFLSLLFIFTSFTPPSHIFQFIHAFYLPPYNSLCIYFPLQFVSFNSVSPPTTPPPHVQFLLVFSTSLCPLTFLLLFLPFSLFALLSFLLLSSYSFFLHPRVFI